MKIKKLLVIVTMLLIPIASQAECLKGNCINGKGVWLEDNGYSYAGQFKNGKKHGQGVDRIGSGKSYRIYNGSFRNDSYNGEGVLYIYNGKESPYIFGTFNDGNLADGTEVLMKFENGVDAYYRVKNTAQGQSSLKLIEEKTADLFCSQNSTYIGCVNRFVWNNKEAILALMAVGYIGAVVNSDTRLSFNDISQGVKFLANTMQKRRDERAQEFANRIAKRLGLPN